MAKYFDKQSLSEMNEVRKQIFALRESMYKKFKVDVLDTDALSSLSIYEIVKLFVMVSFEKLIEIDNSRKLTKYYKAFESILKKLITKSNIVEFRTLLKVSKIRHGMKKKINGHQETPSFLTHYFHTFCIKYLK